MGRIRPNPRQPRRAVSDPELEELAQSIREHGVLQPILVRPTEAGYEVVAGERRLRASKLAGLGTIPAITVNPADAIGSLTIALVENVQRTDLGPMDLARAYKQLHDEFGRTQEEIAKAVGKSRPHVANTLRLLELGEQVVEALEDGRITAGHARALLMAPPEVRNILFQRMVRDGISVRQAERAARAAAKPDGDGSGKPQRPVSADTDRAISLMVLEMERALESALGRKCLITLGKEGAGRIVMEFYSDRDLEALVERLRSN